MSKWQPCERDASCPLQKLTEVPVTCYNGEAYWAETNMESVQSSQYGLYNKKVMYGNGQALGHTGLHTPFTRFMAAKQDPNAGNSCVVNKLLRDKVERYHTHTHTHNRFTALWILSGTIRVSRYQKYHSPTHTHHGHQSSLSAFSIYYDPWHPPYSIHVLYSLFPQSLKTYQKSRI